MSIMTRQTLFNLVSYLSFNKMTISEKKSKNKTYKIVEDTLEYIYSLRANPLARSPGQVKLDSDKWKL